MNKQQKIYRKASQMRKKYSDNPNAEKVIAAYEKASFSNIQAGLHYRISNMSFFEWLWWIFNER